MVIISKGLGENYTRLKKVKHRRAQLWPIGCYPISDDLFHNFASKSGGSAVSN
jgi:hypothetical protein